MDSVESNITSVLSEHEDIRLKAGSVSMLKDFFSHHSLSRLLSEIECFLGHDFKDMCYVYRFEGDNLKLYMAEGGRDIMGLVQTAELPFVPKIVNIAAQQYSPIEIDDIAMSSVCADLRKRCASHEAVSVTSALFSQIISSDSSIAGVFAIFLKDLTCSRVISYAKITLCVEILVIALENLLSENHEEVASPPSSCVTSKCSREKRSNSIAPKFDSLRILLVDDSEDYLELTKLILECLGLVVDTVSDGNQAVASALNGKYDLILMDMEMPVLNGVEACKLLRDNGYTVPIVALTAHGDGARHVEALLSGCSSVLQKPFSKSEVVKLLEFHLNTLETDDMQDRDQGQGPIVSTLEIVSPEMLEVYLKFIRNLPARVDAIKAAVSVENWNEIASIAHKLAGVGNAYGYPQLAREARVLERNILSGESDKARDLTQKVLCTISRILAAKSPYQIENGS